MRYVIDVNGSRVEVALDPDGIRVDDALVDAELSEIDGTSLRLLRIGREVRRVTVRREEGRGRFSLWIDGFRFTVEALDERTRTIRDLSAVSAGPVGPAPLVAPMPGLIVRVHVAVGDAVEAGQGLVVMEAMKMENELRTAAAGTVRAVRTRPGVAVEKGAVLVELE